MEKLILNIIDNIARKCFFKIIQCLNLLFFLRYRKYLKSKLINIKIGKNPTKKFRNSILDKNLALIFLLFSSKAEVLRNLNEKILPQPDKDKDAPNSNRKSWAKETDLTELENKTLMPQSTVKAKEAIPKNVDRPIISPRKAWDLPHQTIIKAFELAEISPTQTIPNLNEADRGSADKDEYKRGETFVIKRKENSGELKSTSSSSGSNLLINEKLPALFDKIDALDKTNKDLIGLIFSPEKIATLKATKNLLLGVTLGQFDPKNTKVNLNYFEI